MRRTLLTLLLLASSVGVSRAATAVASPQTVVAQAQKQWLRELRASARIGIVPRASRVRLGLS